MVAELLLEIGTEEIPSGYLEQGVRSLKQLTDTCLEENRIEIAGGIYTFGTPRRLVLIGKAIAEKQEDLVRQVIGPPCSVAYDEGGNPTRAALGFARKQGVAIDDLQCIETPKGEYLYVESKVPGRPTKDILAEALPDIISRIPWPKSMRWGTVDVPFVRPVHWVLAIMNGEIIPFAFAGVKSGNITWGHRFMAPDPMQIYSVRGYLQGMKEGFILIDQKEREQIIERIAAQAAREAGGRLLEDPELVSTVANLVEYPSAVCGSFERGFLSLPEAVLITAMKEHQKYFAVCDDRGRLLPNFVAVNNTIPKDESVVRKGHERVLRARLSDADFFFKEDTKRPLGSRLEDLKGVIYQAELGTSYAKVRRFTRLAAYLAETLLPEKQDAVKTAAELSKCDLVTHMVTEFPSLQGVIGAAYARREGYPEEVCLAIHEHYLPAKAGDRLPTSETGSLLGLADRMDTIVGCFAIGLVPTGKADPFALRRHALAVIRILENTGWDISFRAFLEKALQILDEEIKFDRKAVFDDVLNFFRDRYRYMMLRAGYESDTVSAVISHSFDRICDLRPRIDQLRRFSLESDDFQPLIVTFKRITNILKNQEQPFEVDPGRFEEPCETSLWKSYCLMKDDIQRLTAEKKYFEAMNLMAGLRSPVDEFFDNVEVFTKKDEKLKKNRVGVLQHIAALFLGVADFSRFSV